MTSHYSPPKADGCSWQGFLGLAAIWVLCWIFEAQVAGALGVAQLGVELYFLLAMAAVGMIALAKWARSLVRHRATSKS